MPANTGPLRQRLAWLEAPAAQPWLALAIFAGASAVRLAFNWAVHPPGEHLISDMWVYDLRARNLLHGTLGVWDTFTPVGYPAILAGLYAVGGGGFGLVATAQALMGGAVAALTHLLAWRLLASGALALLSALLVAAHLPLVLYGGLLLTEVPFTLGLLAFAWLLLRAAERPERLARPLVAGLAFGVATAIRPNLLLFLPALPLWAFFAHRRSWRGALRCSAWVLAGALPLLLAVSLHNSRIASRPVGLATNGGLNFYLAWAPVQGIEYWDGEMWHVIRPIPNLLYHRRVERSPRPLWDEGHFYRKGLQGLRDDPGRLLAGFRNLAEGAGAGRQHFWPGWEGREGLLEVYSRIFFWGCVLPALAFLALRLRRASAAPGAPAGLVALLVGAAALTLFFFLGDPRMRVPFDPFLIILGVGAADALLHAPRRILRAAGRRLSRG